MLPIFRLKGPVKAMARRGKQYERIRYDSGQHRRILLTMAILGLAAFIPIGLRLYDLMVRQYDYYADRALRNQTRSTAITAEGAKSLTGI